MKSILRRYGFHVLMFLCIYFIAFFVIEIAQMYDKTQHVGSQSVDALSNTSIQFALDPESGWDFSFLDDVKQDYALLQRKVDGVPVYRLVSTRNFFQDETGQYYSNSDFEKLRNSFICGEKAGDIFHIKPFVYNNSAYENVGVIKGNSTIAFDYGIYLVGEMESDLPDNELILEGSNQRGINIVFQKICDWAEEKGYTIRVLDRQGAQVNDIFDVSQRSLSILTLTILLLCSGMVITTFFWTKQYDEMREVFFLLGMRNSGWKICRDFVLIFAAVCLCISISCWGKSLGLIGYSLGLIFLFMMACILWCLCHSRGKGFAL